MVAYEKLTNELGQTDIRYMELGFHAKPTAYTIECGTQEYELAPLRTRITAAVIDLTILTVSTSILCNIVGIAGFILAAVFLFVFQWYFLSERFGQTPGKMVMNIYVVRADGEFPSTRDAVWRTVGYIINLLALGFGWLWIIGDKDDQGWHDKLANTYVVRS